MSEGFDTKLLAHLREVIWRSRMTSSAFAVAVGLSAKEISNVLLYDALPPWPVVVCILYKSTPVEEMTALQQRYFRFRNQPTTGPLPDHLAATEQPAPFVQTRPLPAMRAPRLVPAPTRQAPDSETLPTLTAEQRAIMRGLFQPKEPPAHAPQSDTETTHVVQQQKLS